MWPPKQDIQQRTVVSEAVAEMFGYMRWRVAELGNRRSWGVCCLVARRGCHNASFKGLQPKMCCFAFLCGGHLMVSLNWNACAHNKAHKNTCAQAHMKKPTKKYKLQVYKYLGDIKNYNFATLLLSIKRGGYFQQ